MESQPQNPEFRNTYMYKLPIVDILTFKHDKFHAQ